MTSRCAASRFQEGLAIVIHHSARIEFGFRVILAHKRCAFCYRLQSCSLLPEAAPQRRREELHPLSVVLQTARDGLLVGADTDMVDADA
jgi:hypothetical protein